MTPLTNHKKRLCLLAAAAVLLILFFLLPSKGKPAGQPGSPRDYEQIEEDGTLNAVTEYDPISFHAVGDTVAGFHYELLETFAQAHGLRVNLSPEMSLDKQLTGLKSGKYDLMAYGLLATSEVKDSLLLTIPIVLNRQVLVQRKALPRNDTTQRDSLAIRNQLDLAGKTVHVVKDSPAMLRIRNLGDEIGDTIYIREVARYGAEQLISLVAHGDIDYAVCDESIARATLDSLPQIDISLAVGFTQFHCWAVSKQSPALLDSLNTWLASYEQRKEYQALCRKYGLSPVIPSRSATSRP